LVAEYGRNLVFYVQKQKREKSILGEGGVLEFLLLLDGLCGDENL